MNAQLQLGWQQTYVDDKKRQEELYRNIWASDPNYGTAYSDVEDTVAHRILPHVNRLGYGGSCFNVVDFGAGDGRFLRAFGRACEGMLGIGVDLHTPDELPYWIKWVTAPMWLADVKGQYVISTDALEHLPPNKVPQSLFNIGRSAPHGFLRISLIEDRYGTERGLHLHESVFPSEVWLQLCRNAGIKVTSYRVYAGEDGQERALEIWF
jgi:hypothetical protein